MMGWWPTMAANKALLTCPTCGKEANAGNMKRHQVACLREQAGTEQPANGEALVNLILEDDTDDIDVLFQEPDPLDDDETDDTPGWENLSGLQAMVPVQQPVQAIAASTNPFGLIGDPSETGLVLPEDLTIEEWLEEGKRLEQITKATQWWWGDYFKFGERKWPEKYSQALEASGFTSIQTLYNLTWVANAFPPERRLYEKLKFGHYDAVATKKLEPEIQDELLAEAVKDNLSVKELRVKVKEKLGPQPVLAKVELQCQCHCHHATCLECHKPTGAHPKVESPE